MGIEAFLELVYTSELSVDTQRVADWLAKEFIKDNALLNFSADPI